MANEGLTGTTGENRRTEAFQFAVNELPPGIGICYRVDSKGTSWGSIACNGAVAGTTGQHRRAERVQVWLTGNIAAGCEVQYRAQGNGYTWQAWVANSTSAGVNGVRIEALEARLTSQCFQTAPPPPIPPQADCTASPSSGYGPSLFSMFDASGSSDPDGTISTISWDFDFGIPINSGNSSTATAIFPDDPNYNIYYQVKVTVTDNDGLTDSDYCPVQVFCTPAPWNFCF